MRETSISWSISGSRNLLTVYTADPWYLYDLPRSHSCSLSEREEHFGASVGLLDVVKSTGLVTSFSFSDFYVSFSVTLLVTVKVSCIETKQKEKRFKTLFLVFLRLGPANVVWTGLELILYPRLVATQNDPPSLPY